MIKPNDEPKERDIQRAILKILAMNSVLAWKAHSQGVKIAGHGRIPNPSAGIPDICGICKNGRFLGIEVKRPGGTVAEHQTEFMRKILATGGLAFVARSLDDVLAVLPEILAKGCETHLGRS